MQARFCFLCDESRAEGDPLFLSVAKTTGSIAACLQIDCIVALTRSVAGVALLKSTIVYVENVDTINSRRDVKKKKKTSF